MQVPPFEFVKLPQVPRRLPVQLPLAGPLEILHVRTVVLPYGTMLGLAVIVHVGGGRVNVALTVQAPVMAPVVYVVPTKLPPQPLADAVVYPEFAVTVKVVFNPWLTVRDVGLIDPPVPADVLTVYVFSVNVALTVQAPVMAPVVYVVPTKLPPQPLADAVV